MRSCGLEFVPKSNWPHYHKFVTNKRTLSPQSTVKTRTCYSIWWGPNLLNKKVVDCRLIVLIDRLIAIALSISQHLSRALWVDINW